MLDKPASPVGGNGFVAQLRTYLAATLHRDVRLRPWDGARSLPAFMSRRYVYYAGAINAHRCLFAVDLASVDATPAQVEKHIALIAREYGGLVVYAAESLNAPRRARLVASGVPFAVPGNQLYVPELAVDLREHYRARPQRSPKQLSPVAQSVLFYLVLFSNELRSPGASRTPSHLARLLSYSAMSVGRAFEELASAGLADVRKRGRTKEIHLARNARTLIEKFRALLRNPARTRKHVQGQLPVPSMKLAGETALAHLSGLSPPGLPVYAIHGDEWPSVAEANDLTIVDDPDQADSVVEVWYYRPDALSDRGTVDPLSLYAQFWDDADERVAQAAEEALERVPW